MYKFREFFSPWASLEGRGGLLAGELRISLLRLLKQNITARGAQLRLCLFTV